MCKVSIDRECLLGFSDRIARVIGFTIPIVYCKQIIRRFVGEKCS